MNLSNIKTGKISAIRFTTLDAICHTLKCQPGDILEYVEDPKNNDQSDANDLPNLKNNIF